jgi:hypothetical protein
VLSLLLGLLVASGIAHARPALSAAEITRRERLLQQAFALLKETIPRAQNNPLVYRWLDSIHLGKVSYDQNLERILRVISEPFPPADIIYRPREDGVGRGTKSDGTT